MSILADKTDLDDAVEMFKFLSDKNRLRLLLILSRAETCVCDLYDELELAQNLVSYHLGKLKKAGLVRSRREGTWIYYSIDPQGWEQMILPLATLLHIGPLPPQAAYGAGRHCDPAPGVLA